MAEYAGVPIPSAEGFVVVSNFYPDGILDIGTGEGTLTLSLSSDDFMLIDNSHVEYDWASNTEDVSTSASNYNVEGMGGLRKLNGLTISLPEDDPASAEFGILVHGEKYNLYPRIGNTLFFDRIVGAIYRGTSKANDSKSGLSRQMQVHFEFGQYSGGVTGSEQPTYRHWVWSGTSCADFVNALTPTRGTFT